MRKVGSCLVVLWEVCWGVRLISVLALLYIAISHAHFVVLCICTSFGAGARCLCHWFSDWMDWIGLSGLSGAEISHWGWTEGYYVTPNAVDLSRFFLQSANALLCPWAFSMLVSFSNFLILAVRYPVTPFVSTTITRTEAAFSFLALSRWLCFISICGFYPCYPSRSLSFWKRIEESISPCFFISPLVKTRKCNAGNAVVSFSESPLF